MYPAWSPDGSLLAFGWSTNGQSVDLALAATQGRAVRKLTTSPGLDVHSTFSPDGRFVAFVRLPPPSAGGTYFFRYRSVEPDGYVSPYSSTLKIEVPRDWKLLWLLAPLLLLL